VRRHFQTGEEMPRDNKKSLHSKKKIVKSGKNTGKKLFCDLFESKMGL